MQKNTTGWCKIIETTNKSAKIIQGLFHKIKLECFPQAQFIVFSNGILEEFKREFKKTCEISVMKLRPNQLQVTSCNSQSTSKCKN
jgi:hypothetical protein